jgi:hypothetical protein
LKPQETFLDPAEIRSMGEGDGAERPQSSTTSGAD